MPKELKAVFVINGKRMDSLDTETEEYLAKKIISALDGYFESHSAEWKNIVEKAGK